MDADNIDFPGSGRTDQGGVWQRLRAAQRAAGAGAAISGASPARLKVPEDTSGAVIDPAEIHESLIESIIEVDEALMEKYFEGEVPSSDELARLMVRAIADGTLTPILCLSTKAGHGVDELLDFLASSALSPADVQRTATKDGETVELKPDPNGPLAAQVFRTRIDPFVQKLSFVRVFSGTLKKDLQRRMRPPRGKGSRSRNCSASRPAKRSPSIAPDPGTSWPLPRRKNCTRAPASVN